MRRGLWFAAGAGAGIYAVVRARRAAEVLTAEGLQDRLGALALGARLLRDEVAQGKAEAETDLRERMGLLPAGPRRAELTSAVPHDTDTPTEPHTDEEGTS